MTAAVALRARQTVFQPDGRLPFARVLDCLERGLTLFAGAPVASPLALPFCAPFLARGETVVVVDGANAFNLYRLTEWARRQRLDSPALLNRLRVARAFTPFQLETILHHSGAEMERTRAVRLVITGLPDCLYDEELTEPEARATFARCRKQVSRLAERFAVLAFSDPPAHPVGGRRRFWESLVAEARFVFAVHRTAPVWFVPIKAPGLLTLSSEESNHGKNAADRESGAGGES